MYNIHNEIYKEMTESGVVIELENTIWVEKGGNEVNQSQAMSQKNSQSLIYPGTLHVDVTG